MSNQYGTKTAEDWGNELWPETQSWVTKYIDPSIIEAIQRDAFDVGDSEGYARGYRKAIEDAAGLLESRTLDCMCHFAIDKLLPEEGDE